MPQERLVANDNQVKFRSDGALLGQFWARTLNSSPGLTARRDLDRYYHFVNRLVPKFSPAEAMVIITALQDAPEKQSPEAIYLTWAIIADAIRDKGLDQEHGINGDNLISQLRNLHRFEVLAVVDAAERATIVLAREEAKDIAEAAQKVGLTSTPGTSRAPQLKELAAAP